MFRALLRSSSGSEIVLVQHLVSSLSLGDCSGHRLREDESQSISHFSRHKKVVCYRMRQAERRPLKFALSSWSGYTFLYLSLLRLLPQIHRLGKYGEIKKAATAVMIRLETEPTESLTGSRLYGRRAATRFSFYFRPIKKGPF